MNEQADATVLPEEGDTVEVISGPKAGLTGVVLSLETTDNAGRLGDELTRVNIDTSRGAFKTAAKNLRVVRKTGSVVRNFSQKSKNLELDLLSGSKKATPLDIELIAKHRESLKNASHGEIIMAGLALLIPRKDEYAAALIEECQDRADASKE